MNEFTTVTELAARLRIGRPALERMIKSADFPQPVNLMSRKRYWRTSEVDAWLEAR